MMAMKGNAQRRCAEMPSRSDAALPIPAARI